MREDTQEELYDQHQQNSSISSFYPEPNQIQPNNTTEVVSTGVEPEENKPNFIEKLNYQDNHLEKFHTNGMTSKKRINALELSKYYNNYYLETNLYEFSNNKNKIFDLTKSRNYISKAEHFQGYLIKPYTMQPFLYYKIKIKDTAFCTYIDEHYSQHRVYYKLAQNPNNSTT